MTENNCPDEIFLKLYNAWRIAESKVHRIFDETNDDYEDPRYIEAEKIASITVHNFLRQPTSSLRGVLLKLRVACHFEDYMADALDPACTLIGPRAIIAVMYDLENLIAKNAVVTLYHTDDC